MTIQPRYVIFEQVYKISIGFLKNMNNLRCFVHLAVLSLTMSLVRTQNFNVHSQTWQQMWSDMTTADNSYYNKRSTCPWTINGREIEFVTVHSNRGKKSCIDWDKSTESTPYFNDRSACMPVKFNPINKILGFTCVRRLAYVMTTRIHQGDVISNNTDIHTRETEVIPDTKSDEQIFLQNHFNSSATNLFDDSAIDTRTDLPNTRSTSSTNRNIVPSSSSRSQVPLAPSNNSLLASFIYDRRQVFKSASSKENMFNDIFEHQYSSKLSTILKNAMASKVTDNQQSHFIKTSHNTTHTPPNNIS